MKAGNQGKTETGVMFRIINADWQQMKTTTMTKRMMIKNTKPVLRAAFAALLLAGGGLLAAGHASLARATTTATATGVPRASASAPALAPAHLWATPLATLNGRQQTLAVYKGHPVVVNFWASWCGPCVREMPALSALHQEYAKKGIQFAGIGVDSAANVNAFLKKVRVSYPVYIAGFGGTELARSLGDRTGGLPFTVIIDARGVVRATKSGEIRPDELRRTLNAL
jgi:thiol-disulfide isomerase/thioredoxin